MKIIPEVAREMFAAGATDREMAERFGTSPSGVKQWRWRNDLWREGEDVIAHAQESWVPQQNTRLDMDRARSLYNRGATDREIARTFACKISSVRRWRERMALPEHPEPPTKVEQRISTRRCRRCVHGRVLEDGVCVCLYILDREQRRPCPPGDACTEFEPRKRATLRKLLF